MQWRRDCVQRRSRPSSEVVVRRVNEVQAADYKGAAGRGGRGVVGGGKGGYGGRRVVEWGKGGYGGKPWKVSLCSWAARPEPKASDAPSARGEPRHRARVLRLVERPQRVDER